MGNTPAPNPAPADVAADSNVVDPAAVLITDGTVDLDDAQLASLVPKVKGRTAKPSRYLDAIRNLLASGATRGIPVTADRKAAVIMRELKKGQNELNAAAPVGSRLIKVTAQDRSDTVGVNPIVAVTVKLTDDVKQAPVSADAQRVADSATVAA